MAIEVDSLKIKNNRYLLKDHRISDIDIIPQEGGQNPITSGYVYTLKNTIDDILGRIDGSSNLTEVLESLDSRITTLTSKISNNASDVNKLIDKDYVDSTKVSSVDYNNGVFTKTINGNITNIVNINTLKQDLGLSNVNNTSDLDKPISTAMLTALSNKVDKIVGKQLSTEDYTSNEKLKLSRIPNTIVYGFRPVSVEVTGPNPYTKITNLYLTVHNLTTGITNDVDLSDYIVLKDSRNTDFTIVEHDKLTGIATGAQVNTIETIKINGIPQTVTNKIVNLPAYPTTLPASDVYAWAKSSTKPVYTFSEITGTPYTLAGYGITNAYTKDEIAGVIANLQLGEASRKNIGSVTSGNTGLVTGGDVYSAILSNVTSGIHFRGISVTTLTDGGTETAIINGQSLTPSLGDLVVFNNLEYVWDGAKWILFGDSSSYALKTVSILAGDGLSGGGNLTANRTISLSSSTISSLNKANTAYQLPPSGIPKSDLSSAVKASLNKADTALQSHQNISGKADKVSNHTVGNFAALDASGNLIDSGHSPSDYISVQNFAEKADRATTLAGYGITDVRINNGTIIIGSNSITPLTQHQDITGKVDKVIGKELSSNDYSDADKLKLTGLPTNAQLQTNYVSTETDNLQILGKKIFKGGVSIASSSDTYPLTIKTESFQLYPVGYVLSTGIEFKNGLNDAVLGRLKIITVDGSFYRVNSRNETFKIYDEESLAVPTYTISNHTLIIS